MHDYYNYIIFSMKHGIITIYIIDFLKRGIQDRSGETTSDVCRNTHFRDQNVFFIIIHKTIHAQPQWPSSRHLKYYNLYYD